MDDELVIGVVGVCGSGKSTLIDGLAAHGIKARHIAQEHSYVADMWQRLTGPDILIYLQASYPVTLKRKSFHWTEKEYQAEVHRLRHAFKNADIIIETDELSITEVLERALSFLT